MYIRILRLESKFGEYDERKILARNDCRGDLVLMKGTDAKNLFHTFP